MLADHLAILLAERGYEPVDGIGELILRFAAEEPTYAYRSDGDPNQPIAFERWDAPDAIQPANFGSETARSSGNSDWLRLRISVARAKKPPLWTGFIERRLKGGDRRATFLSMVGALMEHWGQTYSEQLAGE